MRDMLSAVNYLHENGIVHRDLKLENFLFEDHNSNSPLILIDFGLSKHISAGERLTQKVGSCYYTAPEVSEHNSSAGDREAHCCAHVHVNTRGG
jgi:calcium-dependent protein kinase